ncbi:MAG TPA: hypothetical protein VG028_14945 [Terriglobia bacterium]|nr:hypothetical protein [Terriglobia bacterium]
MPEPNCEHPRVTSARDHSGHVSSPGIQGKSAEMNFTPGGNAGQPGAQMKRV